MADDAPVLAVNEIRDYQRVNAELALLLDAGHRFVRLTGVERQRLLVSGLDLPWAATVVIDGDAGPELAAGLNAPALTVVCLGSAADGAGSRLAAGRLLVTGQALAAVGYAQTGGTIAIGGDAGPRAGLNQAGGCLFIGGHLGRLAGERQRGGHLFVRKDRMGEHMSVGRSGGHVVAYRPGSHLEGEEARVYVNALGPLHEWLPPSLSGWV